MVLPYTPTNISAVPPPLRPVTQPIFDKGVISIVAPASLPLNALVRADNFLLDEDGRPDLRPGNDWYGSQLPVPQNSPTGLLTNLMTNPSFENGVTTGWFRASPTTSIGVASGIAAPGAGSFSLEVLSNQFSSTARVLGDMPFLVVGQSYEAYVSVLAEGASGVQTITLGYTENGVTDISSVSTVTVNGVWSTLHLTFVAGATGAVLRVESASTGINIGFYLDAVAVGINLTGFFDGNTADTDTLTYAWTGTPNVSTSTRLLAQPPIEGGAFYVTSNEQVHLVAVANGIVYRSLDDGVTWDACTGGSFTVGHAVQAEQIASELYLSDAYDFTLRYVGTTVLKTYDALLTPVAPDAEITGLAGTALQTLTYVISAVNDTGYTATSTIPFTGTTNKVTVDRSRGNFDDSNFVTLTWNKGVADFNGDGLIDTIDVSLLSIHLNDGVYKFPVRYDLYLSVNGADAQYFDSVDVTGLGGGATITYLDKGQVPTNSAVLAPTENTTQGLRAGDMTLVGTRLMATEDIDHPWRVWISGEGVDIGKFSNAFGATYIDLQSGSQFRPVKIADYEDGKANPLATVWCNSADGLGCIWQGTVDTFTVGDISFPVPNFNKLPGSRGTNAPASVVNVLNDYYYYNSQAIYNLGPRAQFLNLLSTDESSANIRPDVRAIRASASAKVCSFFFEAKVYISVPWNSDDNNRIMLYDTERKAWLPKAFDFGVNGFFQYTDTQGKIHLLCWKPGDIRFTEISREIKGNYGQPIIGDLLTGLVHANPKNRMDFMYVEEAEFELSNTAGIINVELIGFTREDGFGTIATKVIEDSTLPIGWTTGKWSKHAWTAGSKTPITNYSEPTTKRYFSIEDDVNCWQWRLTTGEDINSNFVLRTLQVSGSNSDAGKPREWELL